MCVWYGDRMMKGCSLYGGKDKGMYDMGENEVYVVWFNGAWANLHVGRRQVKVRLERGKG